VQEKLGSELTFSELTGIAEAVTRLYQRAGCNIGKYYQVMNMEGESDTLGRGLRLSPCRSNPATASKYVIYQHKELRDHINGFFKNKESHLIPLTLSLDFRDRITSPSITSIRAGYSVGKIILDENARTDDTNQSENDFKMATLRLLYKAKISNKTDFIGCLATNIRDQCVTKSRCGARVGIELKNDLVFLDPRFEWRSNRDVAPESDPSDRNQRAWLAVG
jgi:hemolysin activation/secretion protein